MTFHPPSPSQSPVVLATTAFQAAYHTAPAFVARAPGRVNLLGEHVDYNDGWVLPAAIDRAAYVAAGLGTEGLVELEAPDLGARVSFRLSDLDAKLDAAGSALPRWAWYPAGVAWALRRAGLAVTGLQAVLASNVPVGAGLSSSAAVEMAFATAWQLLGGWLLAPLDLARLCQRAENQYVGVNSGLMDQFASACGQADHLLRLDCRTLAWQSMPLPRGVSIVVADTTLRRELGQSAYNTRRAECEEALRGLRVALGDEHLAALRDVSVEAFNAHAAALDPVVARRARHVIEECARTEAAVPLLQTGRVADFGALMNACHASLRDLYEVSSAELDAMAAAAQQLEGCYGARLTGAGFGGCTVNLVATEAVERFVPALATAYHAATGLTAEIYVCQAAAGAGILPPV
jgi:galactokinase